MKWQTRRRIQEYIVGRMWQRLSSIAGGASLRNQPPNSIAKPSKASAGRIGLLAAMSIGIGGMVGARVGCGDQREPHRSSDSVEREAPKRGQPQSHSVIKEAVLGGFFLAGDAIHFVHRILRGLTVWSRTRRHANLFTQIRNATILAGGDHHLLLIVVAPACLSIKSKET